MLRFKKHKTTVLLFTTAQTNFRTIREELLATLQSTYPSGQLNGQTIPADADDIIFARANNVDDLRAGWTTLTIPTDNDNDYDDAAPPGKKRKAGGDKNMLNCPQGTGLKDGSILAFRFRDEKASTGEVGDGDGEVWDVVIPTFDDESPSQLLAADASPNQR